MVVGVTQRTATGCRRAPVCLSFNFLFVQVCKGEAPIFVCVHKETFVSCVGRDDSVLLLSAALRRSPDLTSQNESQV